MSDTRDAELERLLLELGLDLPLQEMGTRRKDLLFDVRSFRDKILEHLIKLITCPGHSARNSWKVELIAWLENLATARPKKGVKRFKYADFYDTLWKDGFDDPDDPDTMFRLNSRVKQTCSPLGVRDPKLPRTQSQLRQFYQDFARLCAEAPPSGVVRERILSLLARLDPKA